MLVIFTVRNEVAKVMFLQACVCPHGGRVSASVHAGIPPPRSRHLQEQTHTNLPPGADTHTPGSRHPLPGADTPSRVQTPPEQTPPGRDTPWSRHPPGAHPPRADSPQGHSHCCGLRTVRILLECILVCFTHYNK